jgi:CheY-like chemotaxis protein
MADSSDVAAAGRSGAPLRVVLVDDFPDIRRLVAELLEGNGCTIVGEAGDGHEALELLARVECDLVVMDRYMPVMDGLAATRAICERHPQVRVVAFTSDDDPVVAQGIIAAGAEKHFDKTRVREMIRYVVSDRSNGTEAL